MKTIKPIFLFAILIVACTFTQCRKQHIENPHSYSLLDKSLNEIRREIAGKWQFKRSHTEGCGFIAPCWTWDTIYANNTGDYVYFLANDTVMETGSSGSPVKIYEKATVTKQRMYYGANGFPYDVDSAYVFSMSNGFYYWIMAEIKNDSLVLVDGGVWTHYLIRQ